MTQAPSNRPVSRRSPAARLLLPLLLLMLLTHGLALDLRGVWGDETRRLRAINGIELRDDQGRRQHGSPGDVLAYVREYTNYQPLYYLLQHAVVRATGELADTPLRLTNLAVHLVNCLLLWLLTARFRATAARCATVLLFGLSQSMLMHVTHLREYPLMLCWVLASGALGLALLACPAPPRSWRRIRLVAGLAMAILLSFFTHLWAVGFAGLLFAPALLAATPRPACAVPDRRRWRPLRSLCIAWGLALVCILPWVLAGLFGQGKVDVGRWDQGPVTLERFLWGMGNGLQHLVEGMPSQDAPWPGHALALLLAVAASLAVLRRGFGSRDPLVVWCVASVTAFAAFQALYFFAVDGLAIWIRYFIPYAPFLACLAGVGLDEMLTARRHAPVWRSLGALTLLAILLSGGLQVRRHYQDPSLDTGDDLRLVTSRLLAHAAGDDDILASHEVTWWGVVHYWPWPKPIHAALPHSSRLLPEALGGSVSHVLYADAPIAGHAAAVEAALAARGYFLQEKIALAPAIFLHRWSRSGS